MLSDNNNRRQVHNDSSHHATSENLLKITGVFYSWATGTRDTRLIDVTLHDLFIWIPPGK